MSQSGGESAHEIEEGNDFAQAKKLSLLITETPEFRIFVENGSPFMKAPKQVKQVLEQAKDNQTQSLLISNIDLSSITFQPRPTDNHMCMYSFVPNKDEYYHCEECTHSDYETREIVFCEGCFDLSKHQGHHYYKDLCRENESFCDCGSSSKTASNYQCCKHSDKKTIKINITKKERTHFLDTFTSLIEVECYVKSWENSYFNQIIEKINLLCRNSAHYCKLTLELLQSTSKFSFYQLQEEQANIHDTLVPQQFFDVLIEQVALSDTFILLSANQQLKMEIFKWIHKRETEYKPKFHIGKFALANVLDTKTLTTAAKNGLVLKKMYSHYQNLLVQKKGKPEKEMFGQFLALTLPSLDKNEFQDYIDNIGVIVSDEIGWLYLRETLVRYNQYIDDKRKEARKKSEKSKENCHQENISIEKKMTAMVMRCLLCVTRAQTSKIQTIRDKISDIPLDKVLKGILQNFSYCFFEELTLGNGTPSSFLTLFLLIQGTNKPKENFTLMWESILKGRNIDMMITIIYEIACFIVWGQTHFSIQQQIVEALLNESTPNPDRAQIVNEYFYYFLSSRQIIRLQEIHILKNEFVLETPEIAKILRTNCSFNNEEQNFYFNSSPPQPHPFHNFLLSLKEMNIQNLTASMYVNTGVFIDFQEGNLKQCLKDWQIDMLESVFQCPKLERMLSSRYQQIEGKISNAQANLTYLYNFVLVLIDGFSKIKGMTEASNKSRLTKKLHNKNAPEKLEKLLSNCLSETQKHLMKRLFRISENHIDKQQIIEEPVQQKQDNAEIEDKEERKRKFEEKKRRIQEKFQQKRNAHLTIQKSKSMNFMVANDEDLCLICHEKSKPDNQLIYLAQLVANRGFCSTFYGSDDMGNVRVFTCFHTLHIQCFINSHKQSDQLSFNCPLCNIDINIFLPRNLQQQSGSDKLILRNILVAVMVQSFKIYDYDSQFMLFFRHLMESKGLNNLFHFSESSSKLRIHQKNDQLVLSLLMYLYAQRPSQCDTSIVKLMESLSCVKRDTVRLVQMVLCQALFSKLQDCIDLQGLTNNILQLQELLVEGQFLAIREEVEDILQHTLSLIPPKRVGIESLKFKLKDLPRDSTEFLTMLRKKCDSHEMRKIEYYCLICGRGFCKWCKNQDFTHHGEIEAYLTIENFQICLKNNSVDISEKDIYFNEFLVAYCNRQKKTEIYTLDIMQYQAMVEQFLNA